MFGYIHWYVARYIAWYIADNIVCYITCYITICKREKKKIIFDKIPLYLSGFDQGTFHCVHCALPTRPMAPGHDSSVGGIYIDVSWSFLGKFMLSGNVSCNLCENKSIPHRQNICYITCYITCLITLYSMLYSIHCICYITGYITPSISHIVNYLHIGPHY